MDSIDANLSGISVLSLARFTFTSQIFPRGFFHNYLARFTASIVEDEHQFPTTYLYARSQATRDIRMNYKASTSSFIFVPREIYKPHNRDLVYKRLNLLLNQQGFVIFSLTKGHPLLFEKHKMEMRLVKDDPTAVEGNVIEPKDLIDADAVVKIIRETAEVVTISTISIIGARFLARTAEHIIIQMVNGNKNR